MAICTPVRVKELGFHSTAYERPRYYPEACCARPDGCSGTSSQKVSVTMIWSVQIDFQLLGTTIPPTEISRLTGISAEVAMMRGERNAALDLPRQNVWSIRSHAQSDDVLDHWCELSAVLTSRKEVIRDIARSGTAKITLIVNDSRRIPPITIPADMAAFAGFVNAVIDIDHLQS